MTSESPESMRHNGAMGILVPDDFPLSQLKNDEERRVVEALRDGLSDGWLILPDVGLHGSRDRQIDIVLVHQDEGVVVIEVKGHVPDIREGIWHSHGRPMNPQPLEQARDNSYSLRDRLRLIGGELSFLAVDYAVAFPNALNVVGALPPDVDAEQILVGPSFDDTSGAIDRLLYRRTGNSRLAAGSVEAIVHLLRPNATFTWDPEARARMARQRLEQICGQHVRVLERLDVNRRVVVTGGAGTGKTRLAMAWARRAFMRGERVLLTCYNDPLADDMAERLFDHERLMVDSYFRGAFRLEGMPPLVIPPDSNPTFWDVTATDHLRDHWHRVAQRFDTIIIDEAQDFSPAWIAQLTELLDPAGPRRVLMAADEHQALYPRGFELPTVDDGWTRCELVSNCRNTSHIARMLQLKLGGPTVPVAGPESLGVGWRVADTIEQAKRAVIAEIDRLVEREFHDPTKVLVATMSRAMRDELREEFAFGSWESGDGRSIMCETVHRMKGLEFDYVVLVALPSDKVTDELLYVGCSRAVSGLTVIGAEATGQRLGLC
jgi:hypothetical protein